MSTKATTKKVEIWGGFHSQMTPIVVRVAADFDMQYYGIGGLVEHGLSDSQRKRVMRHMCGIKGCMCGTHHGWKWQVVGGE